MESLFLGQQSRSVKKNDLLLSVTRTTAPLSGHSVTTAKQIHKRHTIMVPKSVTMIVCTELNSSGWRFRVEEVSVWFRQSCDVLQQRTAVSVTFINQKSTRRNSSTCLSFCGTHRALALFNAVASRTAH